MLEDTLCQGLASLHQVAVHVSSRLSHFVSTPREQDFKEEFYSTLNAKASTLQVCMFICTPYPCHDKKCYIFSNGDEFKDLDMLAS